MTIIQKVSEPMIVSPLSLPGPFSAAWNFLKSRLASDREKRDFRAESEILDALRHADFNAHKYRITVYMRSGRSIVGRMGLAGEYDHSAYDKHRGSLTIFSDDNYPDGVFYEQCVVRLSEIEGFLLQETNLPSRQD